MVSIIIHILMKKRNFKKTDQTKLKLKNQFELQNQPDVTVQIRIAARLAYIKGNSFNFGWNITFFVFYKISI